MPPKQSNDVMEAPRTTLIPTGKAPGALSLQRCKLAVLKGPGAGGDFELKGDETRVGKSPECDIVVKEGTVSRQHFAIVRDRGNYLVRDLGSTNGTFLDDSRVREAYLKPGSVIRAGDVWFKFQPVHQRVEILPSERERFGELVGKSLKMREIFALMERIAPTEATVLLIGETGTGKGAAARAIHEESKRKGRPFVTVDCMAIAPTLIESELFGHEKGAFTGASSLRRGALETAQGGTLFIDELDDLPLELQPKLMRAMEEREFKRVGSSKPMSLNIRVIAATKKDLWAAVREGKFREDLYFRLSVVTIHMPPLREQKEDLPLLASTFLHDKRWEDLPQAARDQLTSYSWPGNVRELRNVIERAAYLSPGDTSLAGGFPILIKDEEPTAPDRFQVDYTLPFKQAKEELTAAFEHRYLTLLMERCRGRIAQAAREAGIDRKHLYTLLKKHGLDIREG